MSRRISRTCCGAMAGLGVVDDEEEGGGPR